MSQLASVTGDGHVILDYQYLYDRNGNITEKSGGAYQNRYRYDSMNRLREAVYDQGEPEWYSYDRAGNRIKSGKGEYEEQYFYNKKNQLIQLERKLETLHYTYDLQGESFRRGGWRNSETLPLQCAEPADSGGNKSVSSEESL